MQASNRLLDAQYTNKIEGMTVSRFGYIRWLFGP